MLGGVFESLVDRLARWITLYGGRFSAKSYTFGALLVILLCIDYRFIVLARMYEDDVELSIWKNVQDRIYEFGLEEYFTITKTRITCLITGGFFVPFGIANNPGKIKSLEACDLLVIEEGEETTDYAWNKIIPTIRDATGNKATIATIYNPDWEDSATHRRLVAGQEKLIGGRFIRHINYLDNPFCPETQRKEAEQCKIDDYVEYENIFLGIARKVSLRQVFSGVWSVKDFDSELFEKDKYSSDYKGLPKYYGGVAWGISQNPTSALRCCEYDGALYIEHSASAVCELDDMVDVILSVPSSPTFYCPPEKPATRININKRLSPYNLRLASAEKGVDDVLDSIKFLRGNYTHIYIHPRCEDVISDFESYLWETDEKEGLILDTPIDRNNQHFHALRHALHNQIGIGR